ncbi:hypothetical protein F3N42_15030 [Marinihelvus fidelis]|uniref:Uncharacterized protein n=1 Tax=Marinihelvus fidelis TaxID=2613842 RepID=A0A5N0T781_9GAMM|nr:hypothetical protein [Marinihelvus fidelis]KAA9129676.1 hypothetical protein F3N42_15030 [Marinihelvus fidelis]
MERCIQASTLLALALLTAGCASNGRVSSSTLDPQTGEFVQTQYSEYFEDSQVVEDGALKLHLVITLGAERLPKQYEIQNSWGRVQRSQGDIEEVYEVYISNLGESAVDLELSTLNNMALAPASVSITPGSHVKTDPLVRMTSAYKMENPYVLTYNYKGVQKELKGTARRLAFEDLRALKTQQGQSK